MHNALNKCPRDGIGRHNGLKIRGRLLLAGSSPAAGTTQLGIQ